jgi:hypothetical protein
MLFKLHEINIAPRETGKKVYEVNIQIAMCSHDSEGRTFIGSSCVSADELDSQIDRCISELKKLRFPRS